jgi:hypothetical protein
MLRKDGAGGQPMQRATTKRWIFALGFAVVMTVAGCGSTQVPSGQATPQTGTPSKAPNFRADPEVAFRRFVEAMRPFNCSAAYTALYDAAQVGNYAVMKDKAREYRDVVATWDAQLGRILFPAAAQQIVDRMRELNADELDRLNQLTENDLMPIRTLLDLYQADDSALSVEGDRLRAALGHPESQAGVAADQLDLAYTTFYKDFDPAMAQWKAALAAGDLAGAKAANALQEDAFQRYSDALDTIDWPPGFQGQVNTLREHLHLAIEFLRHRVDVDTTAQITRAREDGTPDLAAAEGAEKALWNALVQAYRKAGQESLTC